jgi:hypothetical protein
MTLLDLAVTVVASCFCVEYRRLCVVACLSKFDPQWSMEFPVPIVQSLRSKLSQQSCNSKIVRAKDEKERR